ncbi:hypothetical protein ACIBCT_31540 [Streptosporangium sp. NPDC050855]|uniref:hypothetical protein n=1 Tax=Streptosporangium sp. NPDC050855 TaxID=3366194 RepID=UPI003799B4E8
MVYEVRPEVYKKNAQIAHIYGVKPGSARYRPCQTREEERERDAFKNLLLLCLAHHAEIDDDEELYPPELLFKWKREHEGEHGTQLARIGPINDEILAEVLTEVFMPPVVRLEQIAEQLERTGTLTSESLGELKEIIAVMQDLPTGPDGATARRLAYAAEVFSTIGLAKSASSLSYAAETLPGTLRNLDSKLQQFRDIR